MDRFIDSDFDTHSVEVQKFKIQYGQIYRYVIFWKKLLQKYLKSNMDRFIVQPFQQHFRPLSYLKSNMDRFIGVTDDYIGTDTTI